MTAYVVESIVTDGAGARQGVARLYVATEERAREVARQAPGRTWRAVDAESIPAAAREGLERARAAEG